MKRSRETSLHVVPRTLALLALLVAATLASAGVHGNAVAQQPVARQSGFSHAERALLERGRLVSRPHVPTDREPWLGGVAFQVIDRPPVEVWRALEDVPAYRYMLPGTDLTRADAVEEGATIVYVHQSSMGLSARYWLRMRADGATRSVTFDLDPSRPHDVAEARGFLEIRAFPGSPGRTLVSWGVRTVLGGGPLDAMFRDVVEPWLLRVPSTIKQYLEGRAVQRYRID